MALEDMLRDMAKEISILGRRIKDISELQKKQGDADVRLHLGRAQSIAIVGGVFTPTAHSHFRAIAETGTTDDIVTITPTHAGQLIILAVSPFPHTITLKHGVGNLQLGGSDIVLDTQYKNVMLVYSADLQTWMLVPNY